MKVLQASLAGGEVSPSIDARPDLAKRASGVRLAENWIASITGAMMSRPGQLFVARTKTLATTRVIEFEFNTEQTFIVELGDRYARFFSGGGQIVEASVAISGVTSTTITTGVAHGYSTGDEIVITGVGGVTNLNGRNVKVVVTGATTFTLTDLDDAAITITGTYTSGGGCRRVFELATPYLEADIFDLNYAQSADVLTFTHPGYAPRELVRVTNTNWTLTEVLFEPSQAAPFGLTATLNSTVGTTPLRYKVTANAFDTFEESLAALSDATLSLSAASQAEPCELTFTADHGLLYGDEIHIENVVGMTELNGRRFLVQAVVSSTKVELMSTGRAELDSTGFGAYSSGGTVRRAFVSVSGEDTEWDVDLGWTPIAGAESYNVYREAQGLYSFVGRTDRNVFTDNFIDADESDTAPAAANPFEAGPGFYPSLTGFYQQRQVYANSDAFPNRFWMTQAGVFYNFATSRPLRDDDAIIATLSARRINEIRAILALTDMVLLTSGAEYRIKGVGDSAFTPATINIKPQSYYGCLPLRPIMAGDVALFLSPGQAVREIAYDFSVDKFTGKDVSILARHLVRDHTIVDWEYASAPFSSIWFIRDDGMALCLTYDREQEVYAWSRATTAGKYKSVAVVRENSLDVPYFVVRRTIGGRDVQTIERLDTREFETAEDAFCVDCGLTLDVPITITGATAADPVVITAPSHGLSNGDTVDISGIFEVDLTKTSGERLSADFNGTGFTAANVTTDTFELQNAGNNHDGSGFSAYSSGGVARKAVTTISGLWHLEGGTVVAAANGYVVRDMLVSEGRTTLPHAASRVHIGLPYTCTLETLPLETQTRQGSTSGRAKTLPRVSLLLEDTLGLWVGPSLERMSETKFGLPDRYGQPPELFTGEKSFNLKGDWSKRRSVVIQQRDPLPASVLSVNPELNLGGN